jgi:hypothetical protein
MFIDTLEIAGESKISRAMLDSTKKGVAFPTSPTNGQTFALTAAASGKNPAIYEYSSAESAWIATHPDFDMLPYDVSGAAFGVMNNSDVLLRHLSVRTYSLRAGFAHCQANCATAATVDTYLSIIKLKRTGEQVEIGKIAYLATATRGVFQQIGTGDMKITAGDVLIVQAPANVNQTIANLAFTFAGALI